MKKLWGIIIFVLMLCTQTPGSADAAALEFSADAPNNDQVVWRISINEAPTDLDSFGFDILYDAGKLSYGGTYDTKDTLAQELLVFDIFEQESSDEHIGHIRIGGLGIGTIQQGISGELVRITFDVVAEGDAQMRLANMKDNLLTPDETWDTNLPKSPIVADGQVFSVDEKSPLGTVIGMVSAKDDEEDILTYSMDGASGAFTIDSENGKISVNAPPDYDIRAEYQVTISVSDGEHTTSAAATIQVNDQNNCPQAEAQTFSVSENSPEGTSVGTLAASDSDNASLSYSITGGNAEDAFAIEQATGKISVSDADKLDYETMATYLLTVQVSDGECSETATLTVNIGNVNEAPNADDGTFSIAENSAGSTMIGSVVASDPEGDSLTYRIRSGNDSNFFAISSNGQISVENGAQLDYEATKSYALTVEVSDGTHTDTVTVRINVANQCPSIVENQTFSVPENSSRGTSIGTILTNGDAPATFSIVSGTENAGTLFAVSNDGKITVSSDALLDYEASTSHSFTVQVSDGTCEDTAKIGVNLVNQCPEISNQTFYANEGSEKETFVGTIMAVGDEQQTFSITEGDPGKIFELDSGTGEISVNDPSQLADSHSFTAAVSDGKCGNTATITVKINPGSCSLTVEDAVFSVSGGSSSATVLGKVVASYEGKEMPTYSVISGNDDNVFSIDSRTGAITINEDKSLGCDPASVSPLEVEVSDGECRDTAVITLDMEEIIPGDINGDGKVGLADATSALQILTEDYNGDTNLCADVGGDEKIGVEELVYILKLLAN